MTLTLEALMTIFGLVGSWYVAETGRRAAWGFAAFLASNVFGVAFAIANHHHFMLLQQLGFTALSLRGIWKRWGVDWLNNFDEWVSSDVGMGPTLLIHHLVRWRGRIVDLHTIMAPDVPGCCHTHPALAIRIILWRGYTEQLLDGTLKRWRPGMIGLVRPELSHRIHALHGGRSYSLWLRGRKTHEIHLQGPGWASKTIDQGSPS